MLSASIWMMLYGLSNSKMRVIYTHVISISWQHERALFKRVRYISGKMGTLNWSDFSDQACKKFSYVKVE